MPGGVEIADTVVQDVRSCSPRCYCAQLGGRTVEGLAVRAAPARRCGGPWAAAAALLYRFLLFSVIWVGAAVNAEKEKLLEQLGAGESTTLLVLSAALTCVVAPICEEFLFRGFIFTALRNWRGTWPAAIITGLVFGGVHAGSAPVVDLVPLAALGFGLCLLYRYTGSLYPCIAAHSLNNCIAFGSLEGWGWQQVLPLIVAPCCAIALLALALMRVGVIAPETPARQPGSASARGGSR